MNTVSAVTLTFIQLIIVFGAIYYHHPAFINTMLLYGSPVYFFMASSGIEPEVYSRHAGKLYIAVFQLFKYFFLLRAFTQEPPSMYRASALIMEMVYLALSAYYINGLL